MWSNEICWQENLYKQSVVKVKCDMDSKSMYGEQSENRLENSSRVSGLRVGGQPD